MDAKHVAVVVMVEFPACIRIESDVAGETTDMDSKLRKQQKKKQEVSYSGQYNEWSTILFLWDLKWRRSCVYGCAGETR